MSNNDYIVNRLPTDEDASAWQGASPDIYPEAGLSGEFQMTMYHGASTKGRHASFASDPGDYGRGEYWTNCPQTAEIYAGVGGRVLIREIRLQNALHLSVEEILRLATQVYHTTVMENGSAARLRGSAQFTADMKSKGHDGVVVYGYEALGEWSACLFDPQNSRDP
jgi:hypothetical protein